MPDQKPSIALPLSDVVILGMATDSDVASRAAMSVITKSDEKAR